MSLVKPMRYAEFPPVSALADHVLSHWSFEMRADAAMILHHVWPDGCISVGVHIPRGAMVIGATAEARRVPVEPGMRYWGARFWPDAGARVLGRPAESLRDRLAPAGDVIGSQAAEQLVRSVRASSSDGEVAAAFARVLLPLVQNAAPIDQLVRRVVRAIVAARGEVEIPRLAADVGLGARQLQRRFRAAVGLTPKEYARVRRLRSALAALVAGESSGWARLAAEFGYADQSHLIREFAATTGLTPVALEQRLGIIEHDQVTP